MPPSRASEKESLVRGGAQQNPLQVEVHYGAVSERESQARRGVLLKEDSSFYVICLVILTGDTARGVLFPTLYPRISAMGGNRITQGITVSGSGRSRTHVQKEMLSSNNRSSSRSDRDLANVRSRPFPPGAYSPRRTSAAGARRWATGQCCPGPPWSSSWAP